MGWRESLRPASFRGVPFKVFGHDTSGLARRAQTHEYPGRDRPYVEDLGRQTARFSFEAYVIGEDYFADRDALLEALGERGPGALVHPTLGRREVLCTECSLRESFRDGGMATFSLSFVEAGENRFPAASPPTDSLVATAADSVGLRAREEFLAEFDQGPVPQWVSDAAKALLGDLGQTLLNAALSVPDVVGDLDGLARDLQGLVQTPELFEADAPSLVDLVLGSIRTLAGLGSDAARSFDRLVSLFRWGSDAKPIQATTVQRQQQAARQDALIRLVRRGAALEGARVATRVPLVSYPESVVLRERILELVDQEIDQAGDSGQDDVYTALQGLYSTVSKDLSVRGASLARVRSLTLPGPMPSLVLAYQLYADAGRADELAQRNAVPHPGFLPGGVPLEVLSA